MNQAFGKCARLLTKKDYNFVFDKAKRRSHPQFTLLYRPNQLEYARLGLVVSKKSLSKAVWRNRFKRLVRETFRCHRSSLMTIDIVIIARKGLVRFENAALREELEQAWKSLERD